MAGCVLVGGVPDTMQDDGPMVCKPTPWFLFRAVVMFAMFGVFAVLFYIDGSTGYRKKNVEYFLHQAFKDSSAQFAKMDGDGSLTPEEWRDHAARQSVRFPDDRSILPTQLELPMPWPAVLHDYERMKPLQWKQLWLEYSKEAGMDSVPAEQPYDARKIGEQWVVFWICLALALGAAFFLLRTLGRSISVDERGVKGPGGRHVPFEELKTLDLRKWESKGLAFLDYEGTSGKGRIRIDGLTYGGFKKEQGEPAERLMQRIRERFSGEIIEYAPLAADEPAPGGPQQAG